MPGSRKLGRASDHRKSMLRGMVTYLLESGRIETTVTRAQEVRAMAEKMITIAKDDSLNSKRKVLAYVTKEDVVKKLFDEIAPKYKEVNGGYCRIIKTGPRRGDAAEMAIVKLIGEGEVVKVTEVPIGGYGGFPKADLSEIYIKNWNSNGTTSILTFRPYVPPEPEPDTSAQTTQQILDRLSTLESKLDDILASASANTAPKKGVKLDEY
mgnify:CR=1 FL=1